MSTAETIKHVCRRNSFPGLTSSDFHRINGSVAAPKGPFYREFGKKLAQARHAAKVTQEALAQAIGLSRTSIVNIEKGRQPVHLHLVAQMANSLETEVIKLLPEKSPAAGSEMVSELQKVSPSARSWVERVITQSAFRRESENGTEILTGKAQGAGHPSRHTYKKTSRTS
jgi:DNA-binding XRE family transcriptional regulator